MLTYFCSALNIMSTITKLTETRQFFPLMSICRASVGSGRSCRPPPQCSCIKTVAITEKSNLNSDQILKRLLADTLQKKPDGRN